MKRKNVLSINADAKTIKGTNVGILTGILYLAPFNVSGFQVCPKASKECAAACLYSAGRGAMSNVQKARVNKTIRFFKDRDAFMSDIVHSIAKVERKANKLNMTPAIRLNGTSDIAFEKIAVKRDGKIYHNVMEAYPNVQFYDYTKVLGRKRALVTPNYHLTFSLSEDNDADAIKAMQQGYNVAVVMNIVKKNPKPASWGGFPVIDGDVNDARFLDPKGHIVGLSKKGKAKKSAVGGFIREVNDSFRNNERISLKLVA